MKFKELPFKLIDFSKTTEIKREDVPSPMVYDVMKFNEKIYSNADEKQITAGSQWLKLRQAYMQEELDELSQTIEQVQKYEKMEANEQKLIDVIQTTVLRDKVADDIIDLMYYAIGTLVLLDIDVDDVFTQVHTNNMSKVADKDDYKGCKKTSNFISPTARRLTDIGGK